MIIVLEFLAVLAVVGLIVVVAAAYLIAISLLRPPRMTDGKAVYVLQRLSPGDLQLPFSVINFDLPDEATAGRRKIRIAGWWIPHPSDTDKCVVLIHGYADAKVGAIAWAPLWHSLGYNILAIDLRAHGESGGRNCTAGFFERHDLNAILNQLQAEQPQRTRTLVLFGISLGAAIALAAADAREDISSIVLESPFADYRAAVSSHAKRMGMPTGPTLALALQFAKWISGANFDAVRPIDMVRRSRCPLFLIRGEQENLIPPSDLEAMESAVKERGGSVWIVPGAGHLEGLRVVPDEYVRRIESFVNTTR